MVTLTQLVNLLCYGSYCIQVILPASGSDNLQQNRNKTVTLQLIPAFAAFTGLKNQRKAEVRS